MPEVDRWSEVRKIAAEVVKHFEGCHLTSYVLEDESWATLGWGEAIPLTQHPKTISQAEADSRFNKVLLRKETQLRNEIPAAVLDQLTVSQLAGLLSWRYNVKDSAWLDVRCNTRKALVRGNMRQFVMWHGKWVHGNGGKKLNGLRRRRHIERDLVEGKTLSDIKKANWHIPLYK
ncbi:MAG: hypothetical protein K2X77_06860 [Candidatus Obscuribacterales bacterium]|jgi:GH24 family phage-related lysozyme (muramidase)|nr:hypothetical protein [Candidatus Obscuribacterales bacterium]